MAFGSIWAADATGSRLLRIDPRQPSSPIQIALPNPTAADDLPDFQEADGVTATKTAIWVTSASHSASPASTLQRTAS